MNHRHTCPRCGCHEPRPSRSRRALCDGCRHTNENPTYAWVAAQNEVRTLTRITRPDLAAPDTWVVVAGIRRWVTA